MSLSLAERNVLTSLVNFTYLNAADPYGLKQIIEGYIRVPSDFNSEQIEHLKELLDLVNNNIKLKGDNND